MLPAWRLIHRKQLIFAAAVILFPLVIGVSASQTTTTFSVNTHPHKRRLQRKRTSGDSVQALLTKAVLRAEEDQYDLAIQLTRQALDELRGQKESGTNAIALVVHYLGFLSYSKGDYSNAERYYREAVEISHAPFRGAPSFQPTTYRLGGADVWTHFGMLYHAKGDVNSAVKYYAVGNTIEESFLKGATFGGAFGSLDEPVRLRWVRILSQDMDRTISLHLQVDPKNREAARLALTTILRRKGLVIDSLVNNFWRLRGSLKPEEAQLLDALKTIQIQLEFSSARLSQSSDPQSLLSSINRYEQMLDYYADILGQQLEGRIHLSWRPESLEQIQGAIPHDTVLIEFIRYRPFKAGAVNNNDRWGGPRYGAYIFKSEGDPQGIDLGPADEIDRLIRSFHRHLIPEAFDNDLREDAKTLYNRIISKIIDLLGDARTIFVSPDGQLNALPFAALIDGNGRYLIEDYEIRYLTSGHDLLYLNGSKSGVSRENTFSVVLAYPAFDDSDRTHSSSMQLNSCDQRELSSEPTTPQLSSRQECADGKLPPGFEEKFNVKEIENTKEEAKRLCTILRNVSVRIGSQASESYLKEMKAVPGILHLATHGFSLSPWEADTPDYSADYRRPIQELLPSLPVIRGSSDEAPNTESLLLQSGIALAGANRRKDASGCNGILTASELSGLDLTGTELAFLSSCKSGRGSVINGEGVFGLRRALILAGVESQIVTLWNVDDRASKDLVINYYELLRKGMGRSEALREAQRSMIKGQDIKHRHPYYWAPFIQSGAWTKIDPNLFLSSK